MVIESDDCECSLQAAASSEVPDKKVVSDGTADSSKSSKDGVSLRTDGTGVSSASAASRSESVARDVDEKDDAVRTKEENERLRLQIERMKREISRLRKRHGFSAPDGAVDERQTAPSFDFDPMRSRTAKQRGQYHSLSGSHLPTPPSSPLHHRHSHSIHMAADTSSVIGDGGSSVPSNNSPNYALSTFLTKTKNSDDESDSPATNTAVLPSYSYEYDDDVENDQWDATHHQNVSTGGEAGTIPTRRCSSSLDLDGKTFLEVVKDRGAWLVGLLVLQSMSSFILEQNQHMLQEHLVIINFLTMLVGAGGNAGNQASVRVIRGLAVGTLNERTLRSFLRNEAKMAVCLSAILGTTGLLRASLFRTPIAETIAITLSLYTIVIISIGLGSVLPLLMKYGGVDPAHSSTTIQVLMDILGVTITCHVCSMILQSNVGRVITSYVTFDSDE